MAVDYTYIETPKQFNPDSIEGATGVKINAVLAIPQNAIVLTVETALDSKQLEPLDSYMNDFGFIRNTQ